MYEALDRIATELKFKSPDTPLNDKSRVEAICEAFEVTAASIENEIPNASAETDRSSLKTLSQAFRAASRLVHALHEDIAA